MTASTVALIFTLVIMVVDILTPPSNAIQYVMLYFLVMISMKQK
jgi:hypothetical protein